MVPAEVGVGVTTTGAGVSVTPDAAVGTELVGVYTVGPVGVVAVQVRVVRTLFTRVGANDIAVCPVVPVIVSPVGLVTV